VRRMAPGPARAKPTGRGRRAGRVGSLGVLLGATLMGALPWGLAGQQGGIERCAQGVVGRIVIDNRPVFPVNGEDPRLVRWAFGAANLIHVETTPSFVRRELLFQEGDCYDPFLVSESRRLLDEYSFMDQVRVEVTEPTPGVKTVHVWTRDRWSTQVDLGLTYDDGLNLERFQATENNFLGNGITAQVTHLERRETRDLGFRLFTPRFFGRTDADLRAGRTRGGAFFFQRLNHGFVGEASRFSASELYDLSTRFYSWATDGAEEFSHLLVPMREERAELAAGVRLGDPGRSWILGLSVERSVHRRDGAVEFVRGDDFDGAEPGPLDIPAAVDRQIVDRAATRLALHAGTRRFRYREYVGLDALSEREIVALGFLGGVSVGRSLGIFTPDGIQDADDTYGRLSTTLTLPLGSSILHTSASAEGALADGRWRDFLAQGDVAAWTRASWLPAQTLFFRVSAAGGWRSTLPFQLRLGGREGVRSLPDDAMPGGRRLLLVAEDRIRFPWPAWDGIELGATVFGDAGRVWEGDAPYGRDSGWVGSVGLGLRIATPAGSRQVWRADFVLPLGHDGPWRFRIMTEVNRIRWGFKTPRWLEARRFLRGPEEY